MYMYEENACLDGTESVEEGGNAAWFSQNTVAPPPPPPSTKNSFESNSPNLGVSMVDQATATMGMEAELHLHQQQLAFDMGQQCFDSNDPDRMLSYHEIEEICFNHHHHHQHQEDPLWTEMQNAHQNFSASYPPPPPPNLLNFNLFHHLPPPRSAPSSLNLLPNSSHISFTNPNPACIGMGRGRRAKGTKPFATEKQRRVHLNDKYHALKSLVPNPTKVLIISSFTNIYM